MHYVYVIRCGDGSLYTGYTVDVERRLSEHRAGTGAKYTRGRGPLTLVHTESFESRSAAQQREHTIKQLSKAKKEALVG
ncbi:GIY-YIG nuclease family protein [Halocatena halophila]|uniref:GIY-YIG nuclease family protein n=1 Tax=Halocatena halophila TaxID=2814576 RepID=UPI002ED06598